MTAGRLDPNGEHKLGVQPSQLSVYFCGFQQLMPFRVEHVLLVSSLYESFILEEEGLLTELITSEFVDMNLSHAPRVTRVSSAVEALRVIGEQSVDLVITMTRIGDLAVQEFASAVKWRKPDLPVVVLADEPGELDRQRSITASESVDKVFLWNGDSKIFLAIIKFIEDRINAEHDTRVGDVRVILLVENSIRFYSRYLPLIYTELMKLTQSLITDGVNLMHRLLRMRARPRILLAETFEEAWDLYTRFGTNVLGVISDIRYPREGELDPQAGLELARRIREDAPYLPILLQSSDEGYAYGAGALNAHFLHKKSRNLLQNLREFILSNLGFGDFVFKMEDGEEVGRARDMRELEDRIRSAPIESIRFHAEHNHFSNWLMARTEFDLAARLRPAKVSDFTSIEAMRDYLWQALVEFREKSQTGVITDFSPRKFDVASSFTRIGAGSIGGKGRGLAFVNALIRLHNLSRHFDGVKIFVPNSATLGTDVFDQFLDENNLRGFVAEDVTDEQIAQVFLAARLPKTVSSDLAAFLRFVRYPLAVRSSSLLEDSHGRPFAGVYQTHMLANNHPDISVRLDQLSDAIKRVYASAFSQTAKRYLEATDRHIEEEKMAVILQEIVGSHHGSRFYPTFSGVARSYNFYPIGDASPNEGIATVALGLGRTVVEDGGGLIFSPAHPNVLPQYPTTKDLLSKSQRKFWALDTSHPERYPSIDADANLQLLDLQAAEKDGTLAPIASVYSPENDRVTDGTSREGVRLVTFASVLKSDLIPLADILKLLLKLGAEGTAGPVEIEFAVDLTAEPKEFGFLQIRPIILHAEHDDVHLDDATASQALCFCPNALGHGRTNDITDVIYVMPQTFDAGKTREMAAHVGKMNLALREEGRRSIMIGPGRWGTADRWLGIPVTWDQISTAQLIIETTLHNFLITPSQGTHFFHNLTSLGVGYFTIDSQLGEGFIDWDWLDAQPSLEETAFVRHVRLEQSLEVRIDGRNQRGAVLKAVSGQLPA